MVNENLINELEKQFIELHQTQLKSSRVPEIYWSRLFNKLRNEVTIN